MAQHKENPYKRAKFQHIEKKSPRKFAKGSIRTIAIGKHGKKLRIGCPKGHFKQGRCKVGTETVSMLVPKNPHLKHKYDFVGIVASHIALSAGRELKHYGLRPILVKGPAGAYELYVKKGEGKHALHVLEREYS